MKAWQARRLAASPLCSARSCTPTTEAGSSAFTGSQTMGRPRIAVERGLWMSCTRATKPAVAASHVQAMNSVLDALGGDETGFAVFADSSKQVWSSGAGKTAARTRRRLGSRFGSTHVLARGQARGVAGRDPGRLQSSAGGGGLARSADPVPHVPAAPVAAPVCDAASTAALPPVRAAARRGQRDVVRVRRRAAALAASDRRALRPARWRRGGRERAAVASHGALPGVPRRHAAAQLAQGGGAADAQRGQGGVPSALRLRAACHVAPARGAGAADRRAELERQQRRERAPGICERARARGLRQGG
eukprot:scaffold21897_cov59-Phaeocystis_antarctica.AAC.3